LDAGRIRTTQDPRDIYLAVFQRVCGRRSAVGQECSSCGGDAARTENLFGRESGSASFRSDRDTSAFSNRPLGVKHFQTVLRCSVDVTHGLVLLFGIGTKALPSWDSKTR